MPYASNTTVASGSTPNVPVPFPYLEESDVNVSLNGVVVAQNTLVWLNGGIIQLPSIPAGGTIITVTRTTAAAGLDTQFSDPSVLQAANLNNALLQMLYIVQEALDLGNASNAELATITTYVNTAMAAAAESATAAAASAAGVANELTLATAQAAAALASSLAAANSATTAANAANTAVLVTGGLQFIGGWDASAGTFPGGGTALKGALYRVTVAGTVNSVVWVLGQDIIALKNNPSTSTFATNWMQAPGDSGTAGVTSAQILTALGFTPPANSITVTGAGLATGGGDLTANRTITVTAAVAADIATGTDTTKALTAAALAGQTGTTAGKYLKLDGSAKIPAVDGSQLTNLATTNNRAVKLLGKPSLVGCLNVGNWVTNDNVLWAAGDATNFQNGSPDNAMNTTYPMSVAFNIPPGSITQVLECFGSTFVLDSSGHVYSFGQNDQGQLGQGDTTNRYIATRIEYFVSNGITISKMFGSSEVGDTDNVASVFFLSSAANLYGTGCGAGGVLGIGSTTSQSTPVLITGSVASASCGGGAGASCACLLVVKTDGTLWAAGYNGTGAYGNGTTTSTNTLTATGITGVSQALAMTGDAGGVAGGWSLVLKTNGTLWASGSNSSGQLGQGNTTALHTMTQIGAATTWASICASGSLTGSGMAINAVGELWVWGYNGNGNLGIGSTTNTLSPTKASASFAGTAVKMVMGGGNGDAKAWVLDSSNNIYAAGYCTNGNLGTGDVTQQTTFKKVLGIAGTVSDMAPTGNSALTAAGLKVLYSNGTVGWCGDGTLGQPGDQYLDLHRTLLTNPFFG